MVVSVNICTCVNIYKAYNYKNTDHTEACILLALAEFGAHVAHKTQCMTAWLRLHVLCAQQGAMASYGWQIDV